MKTYFQERQGRRTFRMRVPNSLRPHLGREILYPLKELDLQSALRRCKLLGSRLTQLFDQAKDGRIEMKLLHYLVRQICATMLRDDTGKTDDLEKALLRYDEESLMYQEALRTRDLRLGAPVLQRMKQNGYRMTPCTPEIVETVMDYYRGHLECLRILRERAQGNLNNGYDAPGPDGSFQTMFSPEDIHGGSWAERVLRYRPAEVVQGPAEEQQPQQNEAKNVQVAVSVEALPPGIQNVVTLEKRIELYLKEKGSASRINQKTEKTRQNMMAALLKLIDGKTPLHTIDRFRITELRSVLTRYPKRWKIRYHDKPLTELLKMTPPPEPIGENTQRHYMESISFFFEWAVDCGYMLRNPTQGMVPHSAVEDKTELRPPFTIPEIKKIFADIADMPNHRGFQARTYPFRYWIPLIGLYQGPRLNEICQLHLDDVCVVDNIPCLWIRSNRDRQQKVKNSASIRKIPIHSVLLQLGFLQYVLDEQKKPHRRNNQLFEELTKSIGAFQRKMQVFNTRLHDVLKIDERKSFHVSGLLSYRHVRYSVLRC